MPTKKCSKCNSKKCKCKCKKPKKKVGSKKKIVPPYATNQPYNPNAITYLNGSSGTIPFSSANVQKPINKTNKAEYQVESFINPKNETKKIDDDKMIEEKENKTIKVKKFNGRKSKKQNPDELEKEFYKATVKELKEQCKKWKISTTNFKLKEEYVDAVIKHFKNQGANEEKQKGNKEPIVEEPDDEATVQPVFDQQQIVQQYETPIKTTKNEIKKAFNVPQLKILCNENNIVLKKGILKAEIIELLKNKGIPYYATMSSDVVDENVQNFSAIKHGNEEHKEDVDDDPHPTTPPPTKEHITTRWTNLFKQTPNNLTKPGFDNAQSPNDMFPTMDNFFTPKTNEKEKDETSSKTFI
jgi:hypothetical protein